MTKPQATAARAAALNIMRAIRSGELADRAFARQAAQLPERDIPWLHELVYGTLRLRGRMDYVLSRFVKKGLASLDDDVLDVLRLAAYQLIAMDSVPAYAAVSQAVEMTKALKQRSASGLVNGVLQSLRRSGIGAMEAIEAMEAMEAVEAVEAVEAIEATGRKLANSQIRKFADWGSHPRWLVDRWIACYGEMATARLIAANNTRPELYIRPVGITVDDALGRTESAGITLERVEHAPDALRVVQGSVQQVLATIPAIVQDPAAGLIARYAAPDGGVIADLCAAPGGKAIAMADMVQNRGVVIAGDVSAVRLQKAIENAQRIRSHSHSHLHSPEFVVADARNPAVRDADLVLVDAPCTGTGTFRRHPDGKWRLRAEDLNALVRLQRDILDGASQAVKIGGILVYSTCSIEPEENQEQVSAFLDSHPNFLRRPTLLRGINSLVDHVGNLVVLPHEHGFDGSFAARLERVS